MSKRGFAGLCAAIIAAGSVLLWGMSRGTEQFAAQAQTAPTEIPVTPGVVTARDVPEYLQGIGTVQAFNTVTVKTQVDGTIVKVAFTEGEEVKKGDLLLQIDPRPYQAALEQAQAAKEKDEAQLATAQADLARYARLVTPGFQTRQSYEEQIGLVAQFQAAIKGDAAQIDAAMVNVSYTSIRSAIDGRLGARLVDVGNLVRASDNTSLVTIAQIKPIFVSFTLPQDVLDEVRKYQEKAPLQVAALSSDGNSRLAEGRLTLIDNAIDQSTGTIHLKATFDNKEERLWPGEFVNVRLILRMRPGVLTVPAQTVQRGPEGAFVYIIGKNDTVQRQSVEVSAIQDGLAVVSKGLNPGEHVVVDGQYRLTDGARIRQVPAAQGTSPS